MLLDSIERGSALFRGDALMAAGIAFIKKAAVEKMPDGRYELDGDTLYATIQSYATVPVLEKSPESHRRYIDIQALLEGEEAIGWHPVGRLEAAAPYAAEKDVVWYRNAPGETMVRLEPGVFAVFYPHDAHKPGCCIDAPRAVRKVVVKVAVSAST